MCYKVEYRYIDVIFFKVKKQVTESRFPFFYGNSMIRNV